MHRVCYRWSVVVLKGGDSVRDPHRPSRVLCASDARPHPTTCDSYSSNARELHASCGVRVRLADFDTHGARWLHAGCDRLLRFDDGTIHIDQRAELKPRRALEIRSLLWQRAPCLRNGLAIATRSSLIPRLEQQIELRVIYSRFFDFGTSALLVRATQSTQRVGSIWPSYFLTSDLIECSSAKFC